MKAKGPNQVVIGLKVADSQFIVSTLNGLIIVPKHIWQNVADPATFTNPNPVGTGPFTKITRFTSQDYVLAKNPNVLAGRQAAHPVPRVHAGIVE